jgi:hypothetical protein
MYECNCTTTGKKGPTCDEELDDCLSNPCSNRGTTRCEDGTDDYTCVCVQGFIGEHCGTNEFSGSEILISPSELRVETFTTSASTAQLTIRSVGTGVLFVSTVTFSVPWATVYENIPGDIPDFSNPIRNGTSMQLGVQLSGQITAGEGVYSGVLRVFSSDPNGAVLVPITLVVKTPSLAIIALPQQLMSSLNPQETQAQIITIWNVQSDGELLWRIESYVYVMHLLVSAP